MSRHKNIHMRLIGDSNKYNTNEKKQICGKKGKIDQTFPKV